MNHRIAKSVGDAYKKYYKAFIDLKASKDKLESLIKIIQEKKNKDNEVFKTNWKSYIKLDPVKRKKAQFPLLDFVEVFNDDLIVKGSDTTSLVTI